MLEAPSRVAATLAELAAADADAAGRRGARADQAARGGLAGHARRGGAPPSRRARCAARWSSWSAEPRPPAPADEDEVEGAVRAALDDDPSAGPRQVAELVAAALGVPRRRAYEAALRVRGRRDGGGGTSGRA